jgi:dolichol-phosphate mannosyltransferase
MDKIKRSLSILVPAHNEAQNILPTLECIEKALDGLDMKYEVIVIDDGSVDGTGNIVEEYLQKQPNVRLIRNIENCGIGYSYRRGVSSATMEYVCTIEGDNVWAYETMRRLFSHIGEADIIIGYWKTMWKKRPLMRTIISRFAVCLLNFLMRKNLKAYGFQIQKTKTIQNMEIKSKGYTLMQEILLKSLSGGKTYIELEFDVREREKGNSSFLTLRNILEIIRMLLYFYNQKELKGTYRLFSRKSLP